MYVRQSPSMEDYLEAVAFLRVESGGARISHISRSLGVSMPSVSSAIKKLAEEGLVAHERYGHVHLSSQGERIAKDVIGRHEAMARFLSEVLGVDAKIARADSCRMEHFMSPHTQDRLSKFVEFVLTSPRGTPDWLHHFRYFLERGEHPEKCVARSPGPT